VAPICSPFGAQVGSLICSVWGEYWPETKAEGWPKVAQFLPNCDCKEHGRADLSWDSLLTALVLLPVSI